MLAQEWDWNKYIAVNTRNAVREANEQWESIVADKDAKLADNEAKLADKDAKLAGKDAEIADNEAKLAGKDAEIEALKTRLNALQGQ